MVYDGIIAAVMKSNFNGWWGGCTQAAQAHFVSLLGVKVVIRNVTFS